VAARVRGPVTNGKKRYEMATTHAWFSAASALTGGSSVYRKPSGLTVNVTRMNSEKDGKGSHASDEQYVGEVVRAEDGGCVRPQSRVRGITPD
jgi:hypothetical protein